MKLFFSSLLLLLPLTSIFAQKVPEWQRTYTFEESFIDMNTNVVLGGDIGRVTFRSVFDHPEPLSPTSNLRYKSRLETVEFRCVDKLFRMYEVTFLDSSGKTIHSEMMKSPYEWHRLKSEGPMATMLAQACQLIDATLNPRPSGKSDEELQLDRVYRFALAVKDKLERSRDFRPITDQFFAPNFVDAYLDDDETNWFYNLGRDVAIKASHADLQRFYTAQLNAGYLTSLYLISQSPPIEEDDQAEFIPDQKMIPPDIYQLIDNHSYTRTYKAVAYDYLAESVDSIARMRSYTDLLEKIAVLMRKHVAKVEVERSPQYRNLLYGFTSRVCTSDYLGLPKGTKLFEFTLPGLRLEAADFNGRLRLVSARDSSR